MHKRLSLVIVCLLIFSFITTAFHYHEDAGDHDDCPICTVSHHQQATITASIVLCSITTYTVSTWHSPLTLLFTDTAYTPANDRAPPA